MQNLFCLCNTLNRHNIKFFVVVVPLIIEFTWFVYRQGGLLKEWKTFSVTLNSSCLYVCYCSEEFYSTTSEHLNVKMSVTKARVSENQTEQREWSNCLLAVHYGEIIKPLFNKHQCSMENKWNPDELSDHMQQQIYNHIIIDHCWNCLIPLKTYITTTVNCNYFPTAVIRN